VEQNEWINAQVKEEIDHIARRTRLTEPEARTYYHLKEAYKALREVVGTPVVPGSEHLGREYFNSFLAPHVDAPINFLARRVLERERPEGWVRPEVAAQEKEQPE
jgi:hypothetical protein